MTKKNRYERESAIQNRAKYATAGPWNWRSCGDKSNDAELFVGFSIRNGKVTDDLLPPGRIDLAPYDEEAGCFVQTCGVDHIIASMENDAVYADFEFIAHARTDIPYLLQEVQQLRQTIFWMREALKSASAGRFKSIRAKIDSALASTEEFEP